MINPFKKKLQLLFKQLGYKLFRLKHRPINKKTIDTTNENFIINEVAMERSCKYNIYKIKHGRLYTDRIHNATAILNNSIIKEASYQYGYKGNKTVKLSVENNSVLKNGTPRIKKQLNGNVASLLSGGAANKNYFHWMFDVLPRLAIIEKIIELKNIDYFLLPNTKEKFQVETLSELGISKKKWLSSEKYRHIESTNLIITDHPYSSIDLTNDIQKIPSWISKWLRLKFIKKYDNVPNYKKNIYIKRKANFRNHKRKIINEDKVIDLLLKKNFEIVLLSDLNFVNQISLFKNANLIISLHDAGLANLSFCNEGTNILEIKPYTAGKLYENIAKTNKLNYLYLNYEPKNKNNKNQDGFIEVDLEKLDNIVNNLNEQT